MIFHCNNGCCWCVHLSHRGDSENHGNINRLLHLPVSVVTLMIKEIVTTEGLASATVTSWNSITQYYTVLHSITWYYTVLHSIIYTHGQCLRAEPEDRGWLLQISIQGSLRCKQGNLYHPRINNPRLQQAWPVSKLCWTQCVSGSGILYDAMITMKTT